MMNNTALGAKTQSKDFDVYFRYFGGYKESFQPDL